MKGGRSENLTRSRQELYTPASGRASSVTASVSSYGLMAGVTLESGVRTELMEKVNSLTLMVTFMMASGKTTKQTVSVFTKN